jgi:hypothetical protein
VPILNDIDTDLSLLGFRDAGEQWRNEIEQDIIPGTSPGLMQAAASAWSQIEPLYRQLHTYVRRKLAVRYGEGLVKPRGPIPAHLLGNMWAQSWSAIEEFLTPYPFKRYPDVSAELLRQGYTPQGYVFVWLLRALHAINLRVLLEFCKLRSSGLLQWAYQRCPQTSGGNPLFRSLSIG